MIARAWRPVLAALVLHLVLIQPNHPEAMTPGALLLFPLELPAILLLMLALPQGRVARIVRALLVAALVLIAVVKLADFGTFTAFGRAFNPVLDLHLMDAAWRLGTGTLGTPVAALAVLALIGLLGALVWLLHWALGVWGGLRLPGRAPRLAGMAAALAAVFALAEIGWALRAWSLPYTPPGAAFTARVGWERAVQWRVALQDLAEFRVAATQDPLAGRDRPSGRDRGSRRADPVCRKLWPRQPCEPPLRPHPHRKAGGGGGATGRDRGRRPDGLADIAHFGRAKLAGAWHAGLGAADRKPGPLCRAAGQPAPHALAPCGLGRYSRRSPSARRCNCRGPRRTCWALTGC
jgi:hypothetical protein